MINSRATRSYTSLFKNGSLIFIGGVIPAIVIKRTGQFLYDVFSQGKVHTCHSNVMVENDD